MATTSSPGGYAAAVSPWRQMLPHLEWLAGLPQTDGLFGGLRAFVALACDAPALAGRFVFPSTICVSIFRTPDPIDYLANPMPPRFVVCPRGPAEVLLRHLTAGADEPAREWLVPPGEAIGVIAAEFGEPGG